MDPWRAPGAHYYPPPSNYHQFTDYQPPTPNNQNFAPPNFQNFESGNSNFPPTQIAEKNSNFPDFSNFPPEFPGNYSNFPPFHHFGGQNFEKSINNFTNFEEKNGFSLGVYGEKGTVGGVEKSRNSREIEENGSAIGDNYEWMKPKRQRDSISKKQPTFSKYQQIELEKEFLVEKYVKPNKKVELAKRLDITETQVKTWYQNRRQKEKNIQKNKKRDSNGTDSTRSSATPDSN